MEPTGSWETLSPAIAAAFIAAQVLTYSHCKPHPNCRDAVYVFEDPLGQGDELQRRYTSGAFPLVHAKVIAEAHKFLVDEAKRAKGVL